MLAKPPDIFLVADELGRPDLDHWCNGVMVPRPGVRLVEAAAMQEWDPETYERCRRRYAVWPVRLAYIYAHDPITISSDRSGPPNAWGVTNTLWHSVTGWCMVDPWTWYEEERRAAS